MKYFALQMFSSDGLTELFKNSLVIMSAGDWKADKGRRSKVENAASFESGRFLCCNASG